MGKVKTLTIPEPNYRLEKLLEARRGENVDHALDEDDITVCSGVDPRSPLPSPKIPELERLSIQRDWKHDPEWVASCSRHLLPAPQDALQEATRTIQRELAAMLKEQEDAQRLDELGWYIPPRSFGDNLFQWIVELHSFDQDLPIANDMKRE